jgi:CMP-N,N'-diacetyllegionaminic acid synthase
LSSNRYLALIPARGGSKGLPGKNLTTVGGRPLIAWSIEQALATPEIDRVVVTTDSEAIADAAREAGAEAPFLRPSALAQDDSPTEPALLHAVEWLEREEGWLADAVVLLQPTCPLRPSGALSEAIALFERTGADSLVSAREVHPFLWSADAAGSASAHYDYKRRPRRQDLSDADRRYEENGSIYITATTTLRADRNRLGGRIVLFPMAADASVDIDTASDVRVAEALIAAAAASEAS